MDVTVAIVNHENRRALLDGLGALTADDARRAAVDVIVVDNASRDGSVAAVRAAHPAVEVIAREDRGGYGANHNLALRRARGRHVLLLNDDARVTPGAIDALCDALDAQPGVAVAAPTVRTPSGALEPTLWPRPSLREEVRSALRRDGPATVRGDAPIGWVTGCALMVRRDAVMALGGFDEDFFMYMEETDLCTRLLDAGWRIAHVGRAVVVHDGQLSAAAASPARAVEISRARRRYWRKHYSPAGALLARAVVGARLAALAAAAALRGRPARALLIEAVVCVCDVRRPGLRERADAFNARGAAAAAPPRA